MDELNPIFLDAEGDLSHPFRLVSSSAVSYVGYHAPARVLYVTLLVDGVTRMYGDVPESAYWAMLESESKGRFYNLSVKPFYPLLV